MQRAEPVEELLVELELEGAEVALQHFDGSGAAQDDVSPRLRNCSGERERVGRDAQADGGLHEQGNAAARGMADRLETAGLLRREPADDDGRGLYAVLTDAGNETLRRMWPVYSGVLQETFVTAIPPDEAEGTAVALGRANDAAKALRR